MDLKLLQILACPECQSELDYIGNKSLDNQFVADGQLTCIQCNNIYPIINSIPRFVPKENYTSSFGFQWNKYKYTQVDEYSKALYSEERFKAETKWSPEEMKGNFILDAGCGNGRFVDVCSRLADCQVVGIDMSSAIDAAQELFHDRKNVHLIQASIYKLPFKTGVFDKCYSIGVIQHTPDPELSIAALPKFLKKGGKIVISMYEKKPWTLFYSKYLLRPITKHVNKKTLLFSIRLLSPILFPITEILFRIPILNKLFKFTIPYANYVHMSELTMKQRYEWAILDTFDMLSPAYDLPLTEACARRSLEKEGIQNITRLSNDGLNVGGVLV